MERFLKAEKGWTNGIMNGECIFSGKVQGNRRGLIGNHLLLLTRKLQFGCLKVTFLGNVETVIRLSLGLRHGALTQVIPFWAYCPPFFFFSNNTH